MVHHDPRPRPGLAQEKPRTNKQNSKKLAERFLEQPSYNTIPHYLEFEKETLKPGAEFVQFHVFFSNISPDCCAAGAALR